MRILLVSQMYPSPEEPDYAPFVQQLERALRARGHEIRRAVVDRRRPGDRTKYLDLLRLTVRTARRFRPDVVWAHFLYPTAAIARLVPAPLVVTAHGQDVANIGTLAGARVGTRFVVRRAARVIAVSDYLRRELERKVPESRGKIDVVDCGVDLARFAPADAASARDDVGWGGGDGPRFVCVGSLSERKNVRRLADAFDRLGRGQLAFVGDGPLRPELAGREGIHVAGAVRHEEVPRWLAAADVVCQPSLVEPFGQAVLEALACARTVVATRVGGPPEFVPPEAGVLVDPLDGDALVAALRSAAELPSPNPAARAAAEPHDVNRQAERVEEILVRAARGRRA